MVWGSSSPYHEEGTRLLLDTIDRFTSQAHIEGLCEFAIELLEHWLETKQFASARDLLDKHEKSFFDKALSVNMQRKMSAVLERLKSTPGT